MGATTFENHATGKTLQEAFDKLKKQYQHEYGHNIYSGTVGMKPSVVEIEVPKEYRGKEEEYARLLIDKQDPRVDDPWGPAGGLKLTNKNKWLIFGWAKC